MNDLFRLLVTFGLVLLNAFFVAAEFSLVSVRRSRVEALIKEGNSAAKVVDKALGDLDRYIAATQLGITIASLGLGWVGEPALGHLIEPPLESILEPILHLLPESASEAVSAAALGGAIAFIIITMLHVVIGELIPKSIALQDPENTSLWVARPITWIATLFRLPIWILNGTGNALLRLMGMEAGEDHHATMSLEELKILVRSSEETGVLEEDEREIIEAVFDIRNLLTRQVMVPRTEIDMLQADMSQDEVERHVMQRPFNKYPVYDRDPDDIIGVLYVKDLIGPQQDNATAGSLCTEALFVPENLPVVKLMQLFRESGKHIAIVYDEFGGTEGLVTLDDVLGEIVGELPDRYEYEDAAPDAVTHREDDWLVNGLMTIEDFNEMFDEHLTDENYNTIGGYVMGQLERVPRVGDTVSGGTMILRVESMDALRIDRLSVKRLVPAAPDSAAFEETTEHAPEE
jgi:CBS domain containing-hemolysin-like protein